MLAVSTTPRLSLKNIVVPIDSTAASRAAVDCAIAIASRYESRIILVRAVESATEAQGEGKTESREVHRLIEAEWNLLSEANRCADLQCEQHLLKGTAPEVVEQFLAIEHADLIVLGTSASRGFRRLLMRSAAEHIFRHVRCPVLVIGPSVRSEWMTWNPRHILVASDLETDESRALAYATAVADEHNARPALLHVTLSSAAPYPDDFERIARPYYQSRLQQLISKWRPNSGRSPDLWIEFEQDPVNGIAKVLTRETIDLLILSVHPSAPWTLHFAHNAHRIIAAAPCPILVVQREL